MSPKPANSHVTLTDHATGRSYDLPVVGGTEGPRAIDIRRLLEDCELLTYDPGFSSTGSCASSITWIDGDRGILRYRGYPIEELASRSTFIEVCYLLLYGDLPGQTASERFNTSIKRHSMVHDQLQYFFRGFRRDAHPMAVMVGVVGALSAFYHDSLDINDPEHREISIRRLIAKIPTIAAMAYKYCIGQPFCYPRNDMDYAENFLYMTFAVPTETYRVPEAVSRAMDQIFILHADHEQNASTSTVRLAGSSGANPFACVAAGISSLWGPAHGGANEAVLNMLRQIGSREKVGEWIARAKDKSDSFRLMGFGHRVYRNYDPRADVLKETCHQVLRELGKENDPLLALAMDLERIALDDDYFVERKLYPNVDFYSGIILNAIGFPTTMFTALFAVARCVGWLAQWNEMVTDVDQRIGRPRQVYTGQGARSYVPLAERE